MSCWPWKEPLEEDLEREVLRRGERGALTISLLERERVGVFCGDRRTDVRVRIDLRRAGGCEGVAVRTEDGAGEPGVMEDAAAIE